MDEEKKSQTDTSKLSLPATILLSAIILGGAFYAVQVNKQKSIEKQQQMQLEQQKADKDADNQRADLKLKQDECDALSSGVKQKWNNVMGVTYDDTLWKECVVTYTDTKTGEIKTSPLSLMQTVK